MYCPLFSFASAETLISNNINFSLASHDFDKRTNMGQALQQFLSKEQFISIISLQ